MFAHPQINFQRTPVTLIITALAVALELVSTFNDDLRLYYYNDWKLGIWLQIWLGDHFWQRELWRPFTTTLLHGDLLHALFNVYWMATFGPVLENYLGSFRTLALIVLLAYVSTLCQYVGGAYLDKDSVNAMVGLSGVVYGLFGICYAGRRDHEAFAAACNPGVVQLFVFWFLFCIVLSYAGVLAVGNIAHGSGAAFGLLYGMAIFRPRERHIWVPASVVASLVVLATLVAAPGHPHYEAVKAYREARRLSGQRRQQLEALPRGMRIESVGPADQPADDAPDETDAPSSDATDETARP